MADNVGHDDGDDAAADDGDGDETYDGAVAVMAMVLVFYMLGVIIDAEGGW